MKQEKIAGGRYNSSVTLVPFAGINLIRFRGSRINGLSPCFHTGHSDKKNPPRERGEWL
ncbi:hypothetical protein OUHCRE20_43140 [Enterobacter hormaechei subsp. steigerwaltii]|uniref:Uncharacterized protein n=1 Tax=Enterobacter cloacae TaxID=550 RepID=A0ABD0BX54_ENTCL|nr:hypothetical protein NIHE100087_43840 [Enterobacter hormaechei]GJJ85955.1 hypothetical protein TUM16652_46550 [Enterobacter cloacae]GJJ89360.1 hypothetical protein TUM16653_28460 [Enterobacter cloacae]